MTKDLRPKIHEYRWLIWQEQSGWSSSSLFKEYVKRGYPHYEPKYTDRSVDFMLLEMRRWCTDNIDAGFWDEVLRTFFFTRDEDALLFKLTWE